MDSSAPTGPDGRPDATSRSRMLATFAYEGPDRLPVVYHPSPAGLYVHGRPLLELFNAFPPDNHVAFDTIPHPPASTRSADGRYHELRADDWGTTWEYRIFGLQGHPRAYPFPDWDAARSYVFPPVPAPGTRAYENEKRRVATERERWLVFRGWVSLFEKLHALRPMEEVLMDLLSEDPGLLAFLDRLQAYWAEAIDFYLDIGVDVVMFGDDWGGQHRPIVSPALFRKHFKPRYEALMAPIFQAGRKVFFHSCGRLGELLDELFDLGIDGLWPQIGCHDEAELAGRCRDARVALYLHPDRQRLVPLGTPAEIEDRIRRYADRFHALGGGGIFYVEIENDAPFENVRALVESIHRYR